MSAAGEIKWNEPWRLQYPLVVPWATWRRLWREHWNFYGRPLLIASVPCALILWLVRHNLPRDDLRRIIKAFTAVCLSGFFAPYLVYYVIACVVHCVFPFFPPTVEVSEEGIRLGSTQFPWMGIAKAEVVDYSGRFWLTFLRGRSPYKAEVAPGVDLVALRLLLETYRTAGSPGPTLNPK